MRNHHRTIRYTLLALLFAGMTAPAVVAQDDSSSGDQGAPPAATAPAGPNVENPPLSGLDLPTSEPAFGGRSYLMPGLQLSQSVDSNLAGTTTGNGTHVAGVTTALGSLDLQKIWRRSQLGLDYIAGGNVHTGPTFSNQGRAYQVHTFAAAERILWRTGQLSLRDTFDYLPEGTFGFNSFGGAGSFGSALGSGVSGAGAGTGLGGGLAGGTPAGLYGGNAGYGSLSFQPRINNSSVVDVVQQFSPRTSMTIGGGYSLADYLDKSAATFPIVNSTQTTGQIGFNHLLNPKDQIGVLYAYQDFQFPQSGSGTVTAHVWNVLYGHRITGKLNFTASGGPQLVSIYTPSKVIPLPPLGTITVPSSEKTSITGNGSVTLAYTVSARTSAQLLYQHYLTPGSGFYAGANTDAARIAIGHLFGRHWTTTTDVGYSRSSNLQTTTSSTSSGVHSRTYQFWYAGSSLHRNIGQQFGIFVNYQFSDLGLGQCTATGSVCGQTSTRHTGSIGIDWHPKPIRLD